jgi:hypothetical protein
MTLVKGPVLPLAGGAVLGFLVAALSFGAWAPRPASAQLRATSPNLLPSGQPLGGFQMAAGGGGTPSAQPIAVQALDATSFVVATREPRLVSQIGREGTAQNMIVTVVTHYTVRGDRLIPVEHARVPAGYQLVLLDE